MTHTLKKILDLLPKFNQPEFFSVCIELLELADEYNKVLKNDYSPKIIERILSVLPKLIKD